MGFSDRRDRMTAKVVTDPRPREMATCSTGRPTPPRTVVALRRWRAGGGGGGGGGGGWTLCAKQFWSHKVN
jgi:hypothetical protein